MNILLINNNPLVSRLLALCTRDKGMVLEEVKNVHALQRKSYDVVFVDEASCDDEVLAISDRIKMGRKILLSAGDIAINDFETVIKKPFLPSQIIEVLETTDAVKTQDKENFENSTEQKNSSATQILDEAELEKIKALLDMEEKIEIEDESLSDQEIEDLKVKIIKEQLIADGLEIVEEDEIVEVLSNDDEVIFSTKDKRKKKSSKKKGKKQKKKKKSIVFTEEELERIEEAVRLTMATLKRKQMKKLLKGKEIEVLIQIKEDN